MVAAVFECREFGWVRKSHDQFKTSIGVRNSHAGNSVTDASPLNIFTTQLLGTCYCFSFILLPDSQHTQPNPRSHYQYLSKISGHFGWASLTVLSSPHVIY